jgi:hypothetical protein
VGNGCDDASSPPYKNSGLSMQLKSQELPAFSQTSTKPFSKYHHKIYFVSHKHELPSTVDVKRLRKINKEELRYEITDTSKESIQRQRKPVNKVENPVNMIR